jgi:hypothetical protein
MKLIFENSNGVERIIANPNNEEEAMEAIHAFVDECNAKRTDGKTFKIYYIRSYEHNGRKTFDVGSHVEFFHLVNNI